MADVESKNVSPGNSITESKHVSQRLSQTRPKRDAVVEVTDEGEILICRDCQNKFLFSNGEQDFYREKGFTNKPSRCKPCRLIIKNGSEGSNARRPVDNRPAWMNEEGQNHPEPQQNVHSNGRSNVRKFSHNVRGFERGYQDNREKLRRRESRLTAPLPEPSVWVASGPEFDDIDSSDDDVATTT